MLFLVGWALADCPSQTLESHLQMSLTQAEDAYRDFEMETFEKTMVQARTTVGCLDALVSSRAAAQFHRLAGLDAFARNDTALAEVHFASARLLEPSYTFPEDLVPAGSPLLVHYLARTPSHDAVLPAPATGIRVLVDGTETGRIYSDVPHIVQIAAPEVSTHLVAAEMPLPGYPLLPPPRKLKALPLVLGGVALVGAGVSQGIGFARRESLVWNQEGNAEERFQKLRTNARTTNAVTAVLGAVGAGLVVTAAF